MRMAWLGLMTTLALVGGPGCKDNKTASAACASEGGSDSCQSCCKANGANGHKFVSGSCSCLGGKEGTAPAAPPPVAPPAQAPQPAAAAANAGTFALAKTAFAVGDDVIVTYQRSMLTPPGQQYWITLTPVGAPENEWGTWHYVAPNAKSDIIHVPDPGDFEIRLHDLYPQHPARVIGRQRISVR